MAMRLNLPEVFVRNVKIAFREEGADWLKRLPQLIEDAAEMWGLKEIQQISNLSYNFVAYAERGGNDVVIKIGVPQRELFSEVAALKMFNGNGYCALLDSDKQKGFLLLERLKPGIALAELEDDDERTGIAADVLLQTLKYSGVLVKAHQQAGDGLILLSDWFKGLKEIRPYFGGTTGVFPERLLSDVEAILPDLFVNEKDVTLHGDFHHFNILNSDRGWLAIDPKGVIGPLGYEVGPLMLNPLNSILDWDMFKSRAIRRAYILSERLGLNPESILNWSLAHAVLSAWWDYDEKDASWEYSLNCAKAFYELTRRGI